jgi:hypothetical protein
MFDMLRHSVPHVSDHEQAQKRRRDSRRDSRRHHRRMGPAQALQLSIVGRGQQEKRAGKERKEREGGGHNNESCWYNDIETKRLHARLWTTWCWCWSWCWCRGSKNGEGVKISWCCLLRGRLKIKRFRANP